MGENEIITLDEARDFGLIGGLTPEEAKSLGLDRPVPDLGRDEDGGWV